MTQFKKTFIGKEIEAIEEFFSKDYAAILKALEPSIQAAKAVIDEKGLPYFEKVVADMATAAATALAGGADKPGAGKAALAAIVHTGESSAVSALEALGTDVAKAVATAAVTGGGAQ